MAFDATVEDALLLLTKVSSKLNDRLNSLEKIITSIDKKQKDSKAKEKRRDKPQTTPQIIQPVVPPYVAPKPEKVVEEKQQVIVSDFGRGAEKFLSSLKITQPRLDKIEHKNVGFDEWLNGKIKGILPAAMLALGGLGGLLSSFLDGKLGDMWTAFKTQSLGDIFKKAGEVMYSVVKPIIQSLPIIGPAMSIYESMWAFNRGEGLKGAKLLIQGFIGMLPGMPTSSKAAIIGGVELFGTWLEKKVGPIEIPPGAGADITAMALKTIGHLMPTAALKRLPLVGSLINFYEAYKGFEQGDVEGVARGMLSLTSGIIGLIPAAGLPLKIGLDVLNSFLFAEETTTDQNGVTTTRVNTRQWFNNVIDVLKDKFPLKNLITLGEGLGDIYSGNVAKGIRSISSAIPSLNFISTFMDLSEDTIGIATAISDRNAGDYVKFAKSLRDHITTKIVSFLPRFFGIRKQVADFLGIKVEGSEDIDVEINENVTKPKNLSPNDYKSRRPLNEYIKTYQGEEVKPAKPAPSIDATPYEPYDFDTKRQEKLLADGNTIMEALRDSQSDLLFKQLKAMDNQLKALGEISNILRNQKHMNVGGPTTVVSNFSKGSSLRGLQGVS